MHDSMNRRITVHDVAREAGVSLATVDRVINARPGVRAQTIARVEAAITELGFERDLSASLMARARDLAIVFLIPSQSNAFMASLADAVAEEAVRIARHRIRLETRHFPALDADALAQALDALEPLTCDCAVVVASEDEPVRRAIDRAQKRGIATVTLVSDLPESARQHFIGIDNLAAGRTAAGLLGRFCRTGVIAVIAGSMHLRDHRERFEGFAEIIARDWPGLDLLNPVEAHESDSETAQAARTIIDTKRPVGLYNLGAGNGGLLAALESLTREQRPRVVAHELTSATRRGLEGDLIDIVIDQNPVREVQAAIAAARQLALGGAGVKPELIDIGIFLKHNLR